MTTSDGGVNSDVQNNTAVENTNDNNTQGGQNSRSADAPANASDLQKQFNDLNAKFETLLKESKGKDSKISELLKEKANADLASKTEKEQLEFYRNQNAQYERKEAFRTSFKEVGLNPDDFMGIVDEKDPAIQAGKFAALLKAKQEESAKNALEQFKADELKKIGGEPKVKDTKVKDNPNDLFNSAIRQAAGYNK